MKGNVRKGGQGLWDYFRLRFLSSRYICKNCTLPSPCLSIHLPLSVSSTSRWVGPPAEGSVPARADWSLNCHCCCASDHLEHAGKRKRERVRERERERKERRWETRSVRKNEDEKKMLTEGEWGMRGEKRKEEREKEKNRWIAGKRKYKTLKDNRAASK